MVLIWIFNHSESFKTAKHFEVHLKEFQKKNHLENECSELLEVDKFQSIVFLESSLKNLEVYKLNLKPQRILPHDEWLALLNSLKQD
jgi:hypothetical protein